MTRATADQAIATAEALLEARVLAIIVLTLTSRSRSTSTSSLGPLEVLVTQARKLQAAIAHVDASTAQAVPAVATRGRRALI